MKKLITALFIVCLIGCNVEDCISQIPPQPAYVDELCEAKMPDIISKVNVNDNCEIVSVTQNPSVGSTITPPITGTITATDGDGNITQETFEVYKLDTIHPKIEWVGEIAYNDFPEYSDYFGKFVAGMIMDGKAQLANVGGFQGEVIPEKDGEPAWISYTYDDEQLNKTLCQVAVLKD